MAVVDALRGVAIVAMVIFHAFWDMYFVGLIEANVIEDPLWVGFQRSIVVLFLLLVGTGLVFSHGRGIRWPAFWKRFSLIAGAAMLVTVGTYLQFPDYFAFFGILHAIALFSLVGLLFLDKPLGMIGLVAVLVLVPSMVWQHPVMSERWLSWIGFWPVPPMTTDIVPVFPWFGVVLLGIAGTRVLMGSRFWGPVAGWRLDGLVGRGLQWLGRWSLVIYLVHQPILFFSISWIADQVLGPVL